jgi:hypothetical protein
LKKHIENTRKEKRIVTQLLDDLRNQKDTLDTKICNLKVKNQNESRSKMFINLELIENDLPVVRKDNEQLIRNFETEREQLEEKYHVSSSLYF